MLLFRGHLLRAKSRKKLRPLVHFFFLSSAIKRSLKDGKNVKEVKRTPGSAIRTLPGAGTNDL